MIKNKVPNLILISSFSNAWIWIGFFTIGFGSLFCAAFISPKIFNDIKLNSEHILTRGIVVDIMETSSSINDMPVEEFVYEYETPEHETITSYSYAAGFPKHIDIGDSVNIEIHPQNHYLSRVEHMRTTEFGPTTILIIFLPIVGLVLLLIGFRKAIKRNQLFLYGKPAWGKFIDQKPTGISINEQTQYRFYYEFTTHDNKTIVGSITSHKPEEIRAITDNKLERLLYYSRSPKRILLMDNQSNLVKQFIYDNFPEFQHKRKRKA